MIITEAPQKLQPYLHEFEESFTDPSYRSFVHMVLAIGNSQGKKKHTVRSLWNSLGKGRKGRSTYNWFFNEGQWDTDELAGRKAELFFRAMDLNTDMDMDRDLDVAEEDEEKEERFTSSIPDRHRYLTLTLDDTFVEKTGTEADGVGVFFDHSKGKNGDHIQAQNLVTSTLGCGLRNGVADVYIPHKAKLYIKEEEAKEREDLSFRTKLDIAYEEMVKPLTERVPQGEELMVLFDRWWYSKDLIGDCLDLGHQVTCRLKSNKRVELVDGPHSLVEEEGEKAKTEVTTEKPHVRDYAARLGEESFKEITLKIRGKKKEYSVAETIVKLEGVGKAKLVVSRDPVGRDEDEEEEDFRYCYLISTDTSLTPGEIIGYYESRWNVETVHEEAKGKLGFEDYQLGKKRGIESFIQLIFLTWSLLLLAYWSKKNGQGLTVVRKKLGELLQWIRDWNMILLMKNVLNHFGVYPPPEEVRLVLSELKGENLAT